MDILTEGGKQQVTFITESGLYDVIIRRDSEKAKPFRKWVTSEVLPLSKPCYFFVLPLP